MNGSPPRSNTLAAGTRALPPLTLALLLFLTGCATPPPQALDTVEKTLAGRHVAAAAPLSVQGDSPQLRAAVDALIASPLTPETAVRVALANNRDLRVGLAAASYAEADLIQAAKLPNPELSASTRWPSGGGPATNTVAASVDILDVFLIPLRKRLATEGLTVAEQNAAQSALNLAGEVRVAWHRLATLEEWRARLVSFHAEDSRRLAALGAAGPLTRAHAAQEAGETAEELARTDAALVAAREKLNLLMGFAEAPRWRIAGSEYAVPSTHANQPALERRASAARLDLAARRTEAALIRQGCELAERTRWSPLGVQIGVESEHESTGRRLTGPTVKLGVPLFDQGQAETLRLHTALDQANDRAAALEAEIRSQVRVVAAQVDAAQRTAESCGRVAVPQATRIWNQLLLQSKQGKAGPLALHMARRDLLAATHREIDARFDYWRARSVLATTMGG
jgi:outer membrane protein, heavy metal efflux system